MANIEVGDIQLNGEPYRIDILSYRGRDIIDFAPRASVGTSSVVMSDLGLYQPLVQTDWKHGMGFHWYSDALGYMRSNGNIDTRQNELAMLYTAAVSSDTNNARKDGFVTFGGALYSWGVGGIRKYSAGSWAAVTGFMKVTHGAAFSNTGTAAALTIANVEVQDSANRLLLVAVYQKTGVTLSSVTYGGVAMTEYTTLGTSPKIHLYYLVAPAVGTASVVITGSGAQNAVGIAIPFYNVNQASPMQTAQTNSVASGTSSSITVASAAAREIIDLIVLNAATLPLATSPNVLNTQATVSTSSGSMGIAPGGASVVTGWTWTGATKAEHMIVDINCVSADPDVNYMFSDGDYLFAFPDGARVIKSADGATWSVAGADPGASDFKWAIMHNGFIYAGKDASNQVHYGSEVDLSDLEGTTDDPGTIYCGVGSIPTISAAVYAGNLYVSRQDGVWQISDDGIARKMVDYGNEVSASNLRSMATTNGYLFFAVRDRVIQWNGARVSDITPNKITDSFPYTTYGTFDNFFAVDNFLYCTGRTNEATYTISLLCWDGVGWHRLCDLVTNGTDDISITGFDVVNNRIWYHLNAASDVTYYIQLSSNSSFPYENFPTTGTHSLISSRYDMGFRRAIKSMPSLWVEAENLSDTVYLTVYFQVDGDGVWHLWDTVKKNGITILDFPAGDRTRENYFIQIRIDFTTNSAVQSPILDSYTMRFLMRPDTSIGYNFNILASTYFKSSTMEDERSAADIVRAIRDLRDSKKPIEMVDILGNHIWGYITAIREQPTYIHSASETDDMDVEYFINVNFAEVK